MDDIPVSTQWTLDAVGENGRIAVDSVYMIKGKANSSKGTGFAVGSVIITNEHVVRGNKAEQVFLYSSTGEENSVKKIIVDQLRDLAILFPENENQFGLKLSSDSKIDIGKMVSTWGFPLGYNGPAPLLSVGFLAGFKDLKNDSGVIKRLVVNGAFNPGNSGGPLFLANNHEVIGVVVSKHAPISSFHKNALEVLANNQSGVAFEARDALGNTKTFVESQLVAGLLDAFRNLTQVMIGEAISVEVLREFLKENNISI